MIQLLKSRTTEDVDEPSEIFRKINFLIQKEELCLTASRRHHSSQLCCTRGRRKGAF